VRIAADSWSGTGTKWYGEGPRQAMTSPVNSRSIGSGQPAVAEPAGRCDHAVMRILHQEVVLDTADLAAESAFWARLFGGTVEAEDDWHTVRVDGSGSMGFQLAPDHVPPQWPDGQPQQIHLDLYVEDIREAHAEAMAAGARLLRGADDLDSPGGFQVYADPSGHPFCLCWG